MSEVDSLLRTPAPLTDYSHPRTRSVDASQIEQLDASTPVLLLGGKENALSIARNLGRRGVTVRASGPANCWALYSRFCAEGIPIAASECHADAWDRLLLSPQSVRLHGHVVFPLSDEAIEYVGQRQHQLSAHYLLDPATSSQRADFLDKQRTLELAQTAGFDVPRFQRIGPKSDITSLRDLQFPVIVKPLHTHKFSKIFGRKLFMVGGGWDELKEKVELAQGRGFEVMVVEMVPGADDLLSSYYAYIDRDGECLYEFTKSVIRRYPVHYGNGCFHKAEWLPETAALGRALFDKLGLRGIGNVEFKRDRRDGKLKLIEINTRFTAAQELLTRAGAPLDLAVYRDLTGQPVPRYETYRQGLRLWYPQRDFLSFLELRRAGHLTLASWLTSVWPLVHVMPLADFSDPHPTLGAIAAVVGQFRRSRK
jgi:predicted ATP-grasp superfamily ATP-dependent carboligase